MRTFSTAGSLSQVDGFVVAESRRKVRAVRRARIRGKEVESCMLGGETDLLARRRGGREVEERRARRGGRGRSWRLCGLRDVLGGFREKSGEKTVGLKGLENKEWGFG